MLNCYDGVIPGQVRFDDELTDGEKILYMEIRAARGALGFSRASTAYLIKRQNINRQTLIRRLNHLQERGHIQIKVVRNVRRIYTLEKPLKMEFTPLEKEMMAFKNSTEIVDYIKLRWLENYLEVDSHLTTILYTLANIYLDPAFHGIDVAGEKINFQFLEMLFEVVSVEKMRPIKTKFKEEFGDVENVQVYTLAAVINNHARELVKFRALQRQYPNLSIQKIGEIYHLKQPR